MSADFEKLDVYQAAIDFVITADALVERLPAGRSYLTNQLRRAATAIALSTAEGSGEYDAAGRSRFYRMARRSGYECRSVLDILAALKLADETELKRGRSLLERIGAMLTDMIASVEGRTPNFVRETWGTAAPYLDARERHVAGSRSGAVSRPGSAGTGSARTGSAGMGSGAASGPGSAAGWNSGGDSDSDSDDEDYAPALD